MSVSLLVASSGELPVTLLFYFINAVSSISAYRCRVYFYFYFALSYTCPYSPLWTPSVRFHLSPPCSVAFTSLRLTFFLPGSFRAAVGVPAIRRLPLARLSPSCLQVGSLFSISSFSALRRYFGVSMIDLF